MIVICVVIDIVTRTLTAHHARTVGIAVDHHRTNKSTQFFLPKKRLGKVKNRDYGRDDCNAATQLCGTVLPRAKLLSLPCVSPDMRPRLRDTGVEKLINKIKRMIS